MSTPEILERVAVTIRTLRRDRGITREQLASTAEVDPQLVKRIENGRANPALVVLSRLAAALAISLSLMLSGEIVAEPMLTDAEAFESEAVGETIQTLRKQRQLSRRALARAADLRALTLSRYESATTDARLLAVEPIARALGLDAAGFIRAVESRQRQTDRTRAGWHSPYEGVQCRLVSSGAQCQLWEWRISPHTSFTDEAALTVVEEIATAIRGEVRLESGEESHRLLRGGSVVVPSGQPRRFSNGGNSTARLLRFQVTK
jgi:transcriptional regulator with XRE-family HTH domain